MKLLRRITLLCLALLCVACAPSATLRALTGEEELAPQLRGVGHWVSGELRPRPATETLGPVQHVSLYPYGINTFLQNETEPEKVERSLDLIAEAGFGWIRQEFTWEDIEIHHDEWYVDLRNNEIRNSWEKYDRIVALAEARDLQIIARLSNPPAWSRAAGDANGAKAPPDHLADFGDFVDAVVRRYQGRITYFQIWNEPNCCEEWGTQPVSPEQYTELLAVGYQRAKAANPDAVILTAPLAQTIEMDYSPGGLNDFLFLQRMYNAGAADYFDILAINDYGLWSGPTDRRMRPRVINYSRAEYLRDIMIRNGDREKPIWISEMAWNSTPPESGIYPNFGYVPEAQRGPYLVEAFERQQQEWPWAGVSSVWFFKQPTDEEIDQPQYYFRLLEPDFTPLPAWETVGDYLAKSDPTLYRGWHAADHWLLQAGMTPAPWAAVEDERATFGSYRVGQAGDALTVTVQGDRLELRFVDLTTPVQFTIQQDDGPVTMHEINDATDFQIDLPDPPVTLTLTVVAGELPLDGVVIE
ncbi:MAG: cellulase family glycosylhydrolase [Anaerolineales bacterium]|nr:cellulase family glycosylhydrolase [Anaerolineales bacterium]